MADWVPSNGKGGAIFGMTGEWKNQVKFYDEDAIPGAMWNTNKTRWLRGGVFENTVVQPVNIDIPKASMDTLGMLYYISSGPYSVNITQ